MIEHDLLHAFRYREELDPASLPTEAETAEFMANTEQRFKNFYRALEKEPETLVSVMQTLKKSYESENRNAGRPNICASLISYLVIEPMRKESIEYLNAGDIKNFTMLHDYTSGSSETIGLILESAKLADDAEKSSDISDIGQALEMDINDQTEVFMTLNNINYLVTQSLKADPSGFQLLDSQLKAYEQEDVLLASGAKKAAELYKKLYPLTENLT